MPRQACSVPSEFSGSLFNVSLINLQTTSSASGSDRKLTFLELWRKYLFRRSIGIPNYCEAQPIRAEGDHTNRFPSYWILIPITIVMVGSLDCSTQYRTKLTQLRY